MPPGARPANGVAPPVPSQHAGGPFNRRSILPQDLQKEMLQTLAFIQVRVKMGDIVALGVTTVDNNGMPEHGFLVSPGSPIPMIASYMLAIDDLKLQARETVASYLTTQRQKAQAVAQGAQKETAAVAAAPPAAAPEVAPPVPPSPATPPVAPATVAPAAPVPAPPVSVLAGTSAAVVPPATSAASPPVPSAPPTVPSSEPAVEPELHAKAEQDKPAG
jgi:hypothetical protein